jgi:hypothetical protein
MDQGLCSLAERIADRARLKVLFRERSQSPRTDDRVASMDWSAHRNDPMFKQSSSEGRLAAVNYIKYPI